MAIKLGIVMDPIQSIKIKKDSSFAMLLAGFGHNGGDHRLFVGGGGRWCIFVLRWRNLVCQRGCYLCNRATTGAASCNCGRFRCFGLLGLTGRAAMTMNLIAIACLVGLHIAPRGPARSTAAGVVQLNTVNWAHGQT